MFELNVWFRLNFLDLLGLVGVLPLGSFESLVSKTMASKGLFPCSDDTGRSCRVLASLRFASGALLDFYDTLVLENVIPLLLNGAKLDTAPPLSTEGVAPEECLVDGFSAEQWASYAKRKASIASKVCRQNGWLKSQLNASGAFGLHGTGAFDPWAGKTLPQPAASLLDEHDVWADWQQGAAQVECDALLTDESCIAVVDSIVSTLLSSNVDTSVVGNGASQTNAHWFRKPKKGRMNGRATQSPDTPLPTKCCEVDVAEDLDRLEEVVHSSCNSIRQLAHLAEDSYMRFARHINATFGIAVDEDLILEG